VSDWQVGDTAVCIDNEPRRADAYDAKRCAWLVLGHHYRVRTVGLPYGCIHVEGDGLTAHEGWQPDRFRKIRPDEQQSCEPEFVTLLRRSKQKVSA
jgi:hypothetical protein